MRLPNERIRFIAEKIARELSNSNLASLTQGEEPVVEAASKRLEEDVESERTLDAEIFRVIDDMEEEVDSAYADPKKLFWLLKRFLIDGGEFSGEKERDSKKEDEKDPRTKAFHDRMEALRKRLDALREYVKSKGLILNRDDRANALAHKILDDLYEDDLINYSVDENRVKNLIGKAILDFARRQEELEERVRAKIKSLKRKVLHGTIEYDILFLKYYEEELKRLGL